MLRFLSVSLLLLYRSAAGQSLISLKQQPAMIVPGQTSNITIQAQTTGGPSRVTFESAIQPGFEADMKDDGTGGDLVSGDGIYTIVLPAAPVVAAMRSDDVYRPFLGFIRPYKGSTSPARYNVFAEVTDPGIPKFTVTADAVDVQHTDYLVNILMPQAFPSGASSTIPSQAAIAKRFYQFFPDAFDVLNVVYVPEFFQNRFHYMVRNTVRGIGASLFDNGAQYGSATRLQGITVFPIAGLFDGADTGVQHEFGHQWINFLNVPPLSSGIPHWPLSTMASGVMGFSIPPTNEGGSFPCLIVSDSSGIRLIPTASQPVFNDLDLYLMGLLPPEQVGDQLVLDRQDQSVLSQCNGNAYSFTATKVRVSDLIANPAIGPRAPSSAVAPKQFRLGTILVSRDALLTTEEMAFYSFFAQRMELKNETPIHQGFVKASGKPFAITARGLGSMVSSVTGAASLALSLSELRFTYITGATLPTAQTFTISNGGGGTLAWSASSDATWVNLSSSSGMAPAQVSVNLTPQNLSAGNYTSRITVSSPGSSQIVVVTLMVAPRPAPSVVISSVVHGASFLPGFSGATWITISGSNLSQITRQWRSDDFVNGNLPPSLDGVSVTINRIPAFVYFISPFQINVLAPDDSTVGPVQVQVLNAIGTSNFATAERRAISPGFFTFDSKNVAAVHVDGSLVGPVGLVPGANTSPAKPGEIVLLFGTGFGPTDPILNTARVVSQPAILASPVSLRIGGAAAEVAFAGVTASGLCQFNAKIPDVPDGDALVQATIEGATSQSGISISVKR